MSKRQRRSDNGPGAFVVAPSFKKKKRFQQEEDSYFVSESSSMSRSSKLTTTTESTTTQSRISESNECTVGPGISPKMAYMIHLQSSERYFEGGSFSVVADCNPISGRLAAHYIVLSKQLFKSPLSSRCGYIYTCCCEHGIAQHERLQVTSPLLESNFCDFYNEETARQCLHASVAEALLPTPIEVYTRGSDSDRDDIDPVSVEQLCLDPLLVAVVSNKKVNLLQYNRRSKKVHCSCSHSSRQECSHRREYKRWCNEQDISFDGIPETVISTSNFKSISSERIPYPLPEDLQQVYLEYEMGERKLPCDLVPGVPTSGTKQTCPYGAPWDPRDPVKEGWITGKATIHKEGLSTSYLVREDCLQPIQVYHRFCTGACRCKLFYDGQQDLMFNLNNRDIVYYGMLFGYLHHMLEGRNPLAACHRSYQHSHMVLSGSKCLTIAKLRLAWNAFARLLVIPFDDYFVCPSCGPEPNIIVCDGTAVGCNKSLVDIIPREPVSEMGSIQGTKYHDRTLITDVIARKMILQYTDKSTPLSHNEFTTLMEKFRAKEHLVSLADFMTSLHPDETLRFSSPTKYKKFFKDIASPGPACALLQSASDEHVIYLETVLTSNEPIFQSQYAKVLEFVQRQFPLLCEFLTSSKQGGLIPEVVQRLVCDILSVSSKAYNAPGQRSYSLADNEEMFEGTHFFPTLPKLHRDSKYAINDQQAAQCRQDTQCRKFSRGHPTLSPGIFTIYCQHGICYGFELMQKYESPQVPFSILKTRFQKAPEVVVYDNACKLHAYCLNREPDFFRTTMFVVDRMHWFNHKSCSRGYNMDVYKTRLDIKGINSQVNEQANAGLNRIKAQLAYMLPDNFLFHAGLYLALQNSKKIKKVNAN